MIPSAGAAFAQARIQARYAALPAESDWQALAGARSLAAFLEEARHGPLRDWVKGFSAQSDAHAIERGVRAQYRDSIARSCADLPRRWRPALEWCRWLPELPLVAGLAGQRPLPDSAPGWAGADPVLAKLLDGDSRPDRDARTRGELAELLGPGHAGAGAAADALACAWRDGLRRRLRPLRRAQRRELESLIAVLGAHLSGFGEALPAQGWALRRGLRERLRQRFHRHTLEPVVPFLFAALVALDLERLRRALLDRALFAADAGAADAEAARARRDRAAA